MDKTILATYFDGDGYGYDWLQDDEEVKDWLEEYKDYYTNIEIIRVAIIEKIYVSEDEEDEEDSFSIMYPNIDTEEEKEEILLKNFDKFTS
ncbi:TPA: hypothetical protein ACXDAY_002252 [Clostridium botulinum]|uniref:hypothetical protein n=1 Tax=Clostridium botulinum TaxID=1491 RepID=UPI00046555B2|nr:hypothetical protein [Clostridium botulinum]APR02350.1 hypothetical protein RSJ2_3931 [Clostridium botulinum]AUN01460.1 hypothetical protein RSJ19_00315 [Clostridium botulinum]MBN3352044.1 hypothetical protein [Clostridium botulinum]MBN3359186.1 hypothetical protein [Clostridium botulinum]MBN3367262.1 hypothetical protein [Clostridium botulinum]